MLRSWIDGAREALLPLLQADALLDVLIGTSCILAAFALAGLIVRRQNVQLGWVVLPFSLAILVGGVIYLLAAWWQWDPDHWMRPLMKLVTAGIFFGAAAGLSVLALRSAKARGQTLDQLQDMIRQLEHEIAERKRVEEALQRSRGLLRQLAAYQERVKEDERKRIAREIHDELGQNLMALRIDVSILQARTGRTHPLLNRRVTNSLQHIDTTIKAVRAIINNLRPAVLDLGLHAAIEWQIKEFERRTGIRCELVHADGLAECEMDDDRATAFFRILQESLTNVARHAQASLVCIRLQQLENRFCMVIEDDGIGIFANCRRKPNSFGLLGIEERVSSLGGEFHVDSMPHKGTRLNISIPTVAAMAAA